MSDQELKNVEEEKVVSPFEEQIENKRKEVLAFYKKSKTISTINIAVVLTLVIGAFILFVQNELWMKILGGCIMGACVIYMLVHYLLTRKKVPNKIQEYIAFVTEKFNEHDYEKPDFVDVACDTKEKIDQSDVLADSVYIDYVNFVSRNVVRGLYKGNKFTISELALYGAGEKNARVPLFVGRYISFPNNIKCQGHYIYSVRGEKELDLPNNLAGLSEIYESGNIHVYGAEGEKGISMNKIVNALKAIKMKNPLLNISLVIWEGHSAAYLSFDDTVMGLPFEHPFDVASHDVARDYTKQIFEILSGL